MKKAAILFFLVTFFLCSVVSGGLCQSSKQPQHGGTLRIIAASSPRVVGYYPEMGPN